MQQQLPTGWVKAEAFEVGENVYYHPTLRKYVRVMYHPDDPSRPWYAELMSETEPTMGGRVWEPIKRSHIMMEAYSHAWEYMNKLSGQSQEHKVEGWRGVETKQGIEWYIEPENPGGDFFSAKYDDWGGYWTVIFNPKGLHSGRYTEAEAKRKAEESNTMFSNPQAKSNRFVGKKMRGYHADGSLMWEATILAVAPAGPKFRAGTLSGLLDTGKQVSGQAEDFERWTKEKSKPGNPSWVIRNERTKEYWSNEFGWVGRGSATWFTDEEKRRINLPLEGYWEVAKKSKSTNLNNKGGKLPGVYETGPKPPGPEWFLYQKYTDPNEAGRIADQLDERFDVKIIPWGGWHYLYAKEPKSNPLRICPRCGLDFEGAGIPPEDRRAHVEDCMGTLDSERLSRLRGEVGGNPKQPQTMVGTLPQYMEVWGVSMNCKVCGKHIEKGEGFRMIGTDVYCEAHSPKGNPRSPNPMCSHCKIRPARKPYDLCDECMQKEITKGREQLKKYGNPSDLQSIIQKENEYFKTHGRPTERDFPINDIQREKIQAYYQQHPQARVGKINRGVKVGSPLQSYVGQKVLNFQYDFIIPQHDAELERLLLEREQATYTGTKEDAERLDKIYVRVKTIGGLYLYWA